MGHAHDDLAGSNDLSRLRQGFDHHAVRIGQQDRIARLVAGNGRLGLGCIELGPCRLGVRLNLLVGRFRNRTCGDEGLVSRFLLRGLAHARLGGGNSLLLCLQREPQVLGIDTYERLAAPDVLAGIDRAFQNLSGNSEPEIALHAGRDDPGEGTLRPGGILDSLDPHQRRLGPWVS